MNAETMQMSQNTEERHALAQERAAIKDKVTNDGGDMKQIVLAVINLAEEVLNLAVILGRPDDARMPVSGCGMKAQRCPICEGHGKVAAGFYYDEPAVSPASTNPSHIQCRTCHGSGVLYVMDWPETSPAHFSPNPNLGKATT